MSENERYISRGRCYFCDNTFAKNGITRHLQACQARKTAIASLPKQKTRQTKLFYLIVDGYSDYWLHLEIPADATLRDLDSFLRNVWLECCGHLSAFTISEKRFESHSIDAGWSPYEFEMIDDAVLEDVLAPQIEFQYEYDFGTTTELTIRVLDSYEGRIERGEKGRVLARNLAPDIRCEECDEPATWVCVFCEYRLSPLCDDHAETHEHPDGLLPVINSPRTGMCGYGGPSREEWTSYWNRWY